MNTHAIGHRDHKNSHLPTYPPYLFGRKTGTVRPSSMLGRTVPPANPHPQIFKTGLHIGTGSQCRPIPHQSGNGSDYDNYHNRRKRCSVPSSHTRASPLNIPRARTLGVVGIPCPRAKNVYHTRAPVANPAGTCHAVFTVASKRYRTRASVPQAPHVPRHGIHRSATVPNTAGTKPPRVV